MFNNRKLSVFILLAIFAGLIFYEHIKLNRTLTAVESENLHSASSQDSPANPLSKTDNRNDSHNGNQTEPTAQKPFKIWFADEYKNLEDRTGDQEEKEAVLRDRASRLSSEELSYLRTQATNSTATAKERIAATYLISLGPSIESIIAIAKTPLSLPNPQPVHSIGESLLMQEKAIRVMAIDELFNRALSNSTLRREILQLINQIQDPGLKQYALKRYQELK